LWSVAVISHTAATTCSAIAVYADILLQYMLLMLLSFFTKIDYRFEKINFFDYRICGSLTVDLA